MSTTKTKPLTKELLAGIMDDAMVYRGHADRLELCTQTGMYHVDGTTTADTPPPFATWNYGTLEVIKRGTDFIQRLTHIEGDYIWVRVYRMGVWKSWKTLTMT